MTRPVIALLAAGPAGYHQYILTCWTPKVTKLSMQLENYRVADLVKYLKRMVSAGYATNQQRESIQPLIARPRGA